MSNDVLTIALTLTGFVAGLLIALLYAGARTRSRAEAHAARVNGLQADVTARDRELVDLRSQLEARSRAADEAATELAAVQSELAIQKAQLDETQSDMGAVGDRLNAAEASLLTARAELADRKREIEQWSRAYALLRVTHDEVRTEQSETEERRRQLEDELQTQRLELADLGARLGALQSAAALPDGTVGGSPATLQQRVVAISLLKASAEAGLRRRELELAEVRSQLSSLRFSINVMTSSAAELAAIAAESNADAQVEAAVVDLRPRDVEDELPSRDPAQQAEELAGLQGIISDWFEQLNLHLPYSPALLRSFGGRSVPFAEAAAGADAGEGNRLRVASPELPPSLMLAAIKAASTVAHERSVDRQYELARQLVESRSEYDGLVTRIHAWRTMLTITLQNDADLLRLLEQQDESNAAAQLSACATVALSAYQKKQVRLRRLDMSDSEQPAAPRLSAPAEWAPVVQPVGQSGSAGSSGRGRRGRRNR